MNHLPMADALSTCLLDGVFLPTNEARISPLDRGLLFGDGVYEVIPCYTGKPFRLEAHFNRLQSGLDALGIHNPCSLSRWTELVHELIAANGGGDMGIYIQITRGTGRGRDFMPPPGLNPRVSTSAGGCRKRLSNRSNAALQPSRWKISAGSAATSSPLHFWGP